MIKVTNIGKPKKSCREGVVTHENHAKLNKRPLDEVGNSSSQFSHR